MKILVATTSFPLNQWNNAGQFIWEQVVCLQKKGIRVKVIAPHHKCAHLAENRDGVEIVRFRYMYPESRQTLCYGEGIPTNFGNSISAKFQLLFLFPAFLCSMLRNIRGIDLIFAHWSIAGLVAVLVGRLVRKPVVVMFHHGTNRHKPDILSRFVVKYADHLVFNSSFTLQSMQIKFANKYSVLSPGVDTEKFNATVDSSPFSKWFPEIKSSDQVLLSIGSLIELKGHLTLIRAFSAMKDVNGLFLVIVGNGPLKKKLLHFAREKGVLEKVFFCDPVGHEHLPVFYRRATLLVHPSIVDGGGNTEGLGMVVLEALACGTPCVASSVGGIPEIIADGQNGLLVKPDDPEELSEKISILLSNQDMRKKMKAIGRYRVLNGFSLERRTRELLSLFNSLLCK